MGQVSFTSIFYGDILFSHDFFGTRSVPGKNSGLFHVSWTCVGEELSEDVVAMQSICFLLTFYYWIFMDFHFTKTSRNTVA